MRAVEAASRVLTHRVVRGAAALAAARVVAVLCSLVIVSVMVRTFDAVEFGFWSVLASLTTLVVGLDFGIGNAARNRMAALRAAGDEAGAAAHYGGTLLVLALLALSVTVIAEVAMVGARRLGVIAWPADQLGAAMIAAACLGLFQTANLGVMALYAREESFTVAVLEMGRWVLMLAALLVAGLARASLVGASAVYFGMLAFGSLMSLVVVARVPSWRRRPPPPRIVVRMVKADVRAAGGFAALQGVAALVYQSDTLIASLLLPLERVGDYALVLRLFSMPFSLLTSAIVPLWSRAAIEFARGERAQVQQLADRSARVALLLVGLAGASLVVLGPAFVQAWAGRAIDDLPLYLGFAAWLVVAGCVAVYSTVLNGMGRVRRQTAFLALALALKVVFASALVGRIGLSALAWGAAFALLPLAWSDHRELRRALAGAT